MKDWLAYFFGQGQIDEFRNFSLAHLLPILVTVAVIFAIYRFRGQLAASKWDRMLRYVLAFMMIFSEMSYYWRLVGNAQMLNPSAADHLPVTICGWVIVFGSYMLVGKSKGLFDICYFWVLSGTIFALITPGAVLTYTGPGRFRYYQFWLEHTLGYVAVFYMIFVHKMRPDLKAAIKAYILLLVLAAVAMLVNGMVPGANYLFLAQAEDGASLLDILPSNIVLRLLLMSAAVTVLFALSYLPWLMMDRKAKKKEQIPA